MRKLIWLLAILFSTQTIALAGEGMWLPWLLSAMQESDMQKMGMKMTRQDIYDVNNGSLKDAIVSFGGFCTAEVISNQGLLLTNHHCGYSDIQSHSTVENNYLDDGFWAATRNEELPNEGLTATFIVRVDDVTKDVLRDLDPAMTSKERQSAIDMNIAGVENRAIKQTHEEVFVRSFYGDQKFFLFVTVTYRDVRLVGAPPSSIGKFGSDTDNWVWPRHTGDFALFRIYADENNMPADYSEDNVPYQPKHFLPISTDGASADDFTMIFGFPGRTNEYLPSEAVRQTIEVLNPARIEIREKALKIMDTYMRADEQTRIQYASKYAGIANYWKKWIGESQGLKATNALEKKRKTEQRYRDMLIKHDEFASKYSGILEDLNEMYVDIEDLALAREYYSEVFSRNIEILRIAGYFNRLKGLKEKGGEAAYNEFKGRLTGYLPGFYKNYRSEIDKDVFAALVEIYLNNMPIGEAIKPVTDELKMVGKKNISGLADKLYDNTSISNWEEAEKLLNMPMEDAIAAMEKDPLMQFASSLKAAYDEHISAPYNQLKSHIDENQKKYLKAMMIVLPSPFYYPDANSTLRLSYGQVEGYSSFDGTAYNTHTYLSGLMDKYKPGDYEFDVPEKLQELYKKKDYGSYKAKNGKMPVCFIGSNHTTGGNSGSPAIDAYGNLIGLNFDRVWEGTMSDINYDKTYCRNIMVDARYILFIIDKFADAKHLIKEMRLVQPKTNPLSMYEKEDPYQKAKNASPMINVPDALKTVDQKEEQLIRRDLMDEEKHIKRRNKKKKKKDK